MTAELKFPDRGVKSWSNPWVDPELRELNRTLGPDDPDWWPYAKLVELGPKPKFPAKLVVGDTIRFAQGLWFVHGAKGALKWSGTVEPNAGGGRWIMIHSELDEHR